VCSLRSRCRAPTRAAPARSVSRTGVLMVSYGSHMAFFETGDLPFEFKPQHDVDLHIALEVDPEALPVLLAKSKAT
jgi:hypothetical protein